MPSRSFRAISFLFLIRSFLLGCVFLSGFTKPVFASSVNDYLVTSATSLDSWLKQESVHLRYQLTGQFHHIPYSLPAEMFWQISPGHYKVKFEIAHFLLGTRTQVSEGTVNAELGILPAKFTDKIKAEDQVIFNHSTGLLQFTTKSVPETLDATAQDQLSVISQLGFWIVKNQDQLNKGSKTKIQLVSKNNAEHREFQYLGTETLDLPVGRVETYKFTRTQRSSDDQRATVWLLKNSGLSLARIRLEEENSDYVDQKLSQVEMITGLK